MDEEIELLGAMLDLELAGDDLEDDMLGARRIRRGGSRRRAMKRRAYRNALVPSTPGVPKAGARDFPLGFGQFTFVNGGVTVANLVASPQRPFKGQRLVINVTRSTGATAEQVTVTSLNVGQNNQLVSVAALPAEAFAPGAFQTELSLDPATPGVDITLGLAISAAPGVGETVNVSALLIGKAIG